MTPTTLRASAHGRARLFVAAVAALLATGASRSAPASPAVAASRAAHPRWLATWTASPQPAARPLALHAQTVRQVVHVSLGGARIRVRISNAYGSAPLHVGAVHVALPAHAPAVAAGSDRRVTFGGAPDVVIPPGALALSDPAALALPAGGDVAVSLYLPDATSGSTTHATASATTWIAPGDASAAATFAATQTLPVRLFLAGVDVEAAAGARTIVALGDSITDGMGSTPDANHRWPDFLAARLRAAGRPLAVVDQGISGNCLLRDLVGASAQARLDRDVLAQPGVATVVVLLGTNDIGVPLGPGQPGASAAQVIAGLGQVVERLHAAGLVVIGGTLTPLDDDDAAEEQRRQDINRWIRTGHAYDAVVDFDLAVRDPANPRKLRPAFDSGDHLHPNDAGYQAMADAFALARF